MIYQASLYIGAVVLLSAAPSHAQSGVKGGGSKAKPGTCSQTAQSGIRECYPLHGRGNFNVSVFPRKAVWVQLPEPITNALPPPRSLFAFQQSADNKHFISIIPLTGRIPGTATAVLRTAKLTITLTFTVAKTAARADSQIHIVHFDKRGKDAETERRLRTQAAQLQREFERKLQVVKRESKTAALRGLLRQMAGSGGVHVREARGRRVARNNRLILRAKRRVRLGSAVVVHFTLRNRSPKLFHVGALTLSRGRAGSHRPLPKALVACNARRLSPNRLTTCYALLRGSRQFAADERLRIRVKERRGDRSVTLRGIDVR